VTVGVAVGMVWGRGANSKAVANFLGQSTTKAAEIYIHAADGESWDVAQRLETGMADIVTTTPEQESGSEKP
jgi:hypothetical protein